MKAENPLVTIILPVRNEAKYITVCLESVFRQDYPHDHMEIIIADGLSTDSTREAVAEFSHRGIPLYWIANPDKIVPTGLNHAIRLAKGEIIIRIDGHTIITPDYVTQCVSVLDYSNADNVGGCMNAKGPSYFGNATAIATSTPFGVGGSRFHYSEKEEWVDSVYLGAWPRRIFEEIGLFDEELVRDQDDEFNYRLRELGGKILLSPKIKSVYMVRSSPKALWNQYYQYGYWKVRVLQKHPYQMSLRQFVPPAFVLALLVALLFTAIIPWGWVIFLMVLGCYLIANLAASFFTSAKEGWQHLPLLPLVFAILHLSYGLGFLVGLFKFWNRWSDKKGKVPDFISDFSISPGPDSAL